MTSVCLPLHYIWHLCAYLYIRCDICLLTFTLDMISVCLPLHLIWYLCAYLYIRYDIYVFLGYIGQLRSHSVPCVNKDGIVWLRPPLLKNSSHPVYFTTLLRVFRNQATWLKGQMWKKIQIVIVKVGILHQGFYFLWACCVVSGCDSGSMEPVMVLVILKDVIVLFMAAVAQIILMVKYWLHQWYLRVIMAVITV